MIIILRLQILEVSGMCDQCDAPNCHYAQFSKIPLKMSEVNKNSTQNMTLPDAATKTKTAHNDSYTQFPCNATPQQESSKGTLRTPSIFKIDKKISPGARSDADSDSEEDFVKDFDLANVNVGLRSVLDGLKNMPGQQNPDYAQVELLCNDFELGAIDTHGTPLILPKGIYTDNCCNGIPSLTRPNIANSNNAQLMTFDELTTDDDKVPNTEEYSIKLQVKDPKAPPAHKGIYTEYKPKIKFQLCPTPHHIYNLDETVVFTARCMSWNCPACKHLMKLRHYIKLCQKLDDRGTDNLKVIAFTLASPYDDEGYWVEIGQKFSYMRRRINSRRKCSHCPTSIRYSKDYKGPKIAKFGFCFEEVSEEEGDGYCRYEIPEYHWIREIQMERLEKYGIAVRHLHMLGWFGFIPWKLIDHYWPYGDFKIQSLDKKDAEKAAKYMIQYLNKEQQQRRFFKGERRLGNSRGFFEGMDKAGNKLPEIIQEWKNFLIPAFYWPHEIWIVKTYWATPLHIVMKALALECAKDHAQTKLT